jgi:uncharacterized C2H2 Zn-finger protein
MFRALVDNGLQFLERSLDDLDKHPNFSVINFYTAVELLLKARLMLEHWTLVLAPSKGSKDEPSWEKFKQGNFKSVSLDDIKIRLFNVAQVQISDAIWECFKKLRYHRNKVIHFHAPFKTTEEGRKGQVDIIREQLHGWYYLHDMLTVRWQKEFRHAKKEIEHLDKTIKSRSKPYLEVVYSKIKSEISTLKKSGEMFHACPICKYKSFQLSEVIEGLLYQGKCKVCQYTERMLTLSCRECDTKVDLFGGSFGNCPKCGEIFDDKSTAKNFALYLDDHMGIEVAHCCYCENHYTVGYKDGHWFCASCLEDFDSVWHCECCGEANAGPEKEMSYLQGCTICEGRYGPDDN